MLQFDWLLALDFYGVIVDNQVLNLQPYISVGKSTFTGPKELHCLSKLIQNFPEL